MQIEVDIIEHSSSNNHFMGKRLVVGVKVKQKTVWKKILQRLCMTLASLTTLFTILKITGGVTSEQYWDKVEKLCTKIGFESALLWTSKLT